MRATVLSPPAEDPDIDALIAARPQLSLHALAGLCLDGQPLAAIADAVGTPTWVYGAPTLRHRFRTLLAALNAAGLRAELHYAVKANDRLAVLRVLGSLGAGADVVSAGELRRARAAGIRPRSIVFSGVGKTVQELDLALAENIEQINVESAEELTMLSARAVAHGRTARVALRINPDVDAGTHAKITTGRADNKFGIPFDQAASLYAEAARLPGIAPVGLAVHIGSQILAAAPYRAAYQRAADLVIALRSQGLVVERLDCGGGLGIGYRDEAGFSPEVFAGTIRSTLGGLGLQLLVEPGRWLVGPAGLLLASVVLVKGGTRHQFVVLDTAMNDLIRPSMYDAWHGIVPVSAAARSQPLRSVDVVGPICESADTFARGRVLPELTAGARVAILDAGAYGAVMSSGYNARPLAAEVMVDEVAGAPRWDLIRARQSVEAMWAGEHVPDWLE